MYLFGDIDQTIWKPLLDAYKLPAWTVPNHDPALSFGIAGSGTGVPFHFHGPGFAEIIHGSKASVFNFLKHLIVFFSSVGFFNLSMNVRILILTNLPWIGI